jgi:hypothetical protein
MKNLLISLAVIIILISGCRENTTEVTLPEIPPDPSGSVPVTMKNNVVPSGKFFTVELERRRLNLSGIVINGYGVPLYGTGDPDQNIWLEVDGVNKGILVKRVSPQNRLKADIVFCVDVSGSMNDAVVDSIANSLAGFSDYLYRNGIDARFGGVGFVGDIRGVKLLNDDVANFRAWIKSKRFIDTATQVLFPQFGSSSLNENPVSAIRYADSLFNWRQDAQKVFYVFADVPIKPSSREDWATQWVRSNLRGKGIVHVVFASDTTRYTNLWSTPNLSYQNPKDLATITGGTYQLISDGYNLNLLYSPIVESLIYSHSIDFMTSNGKKRIKIVTSISSNYDGKSEVEVEF